MKPDNDNDKRVLSRWILIWLALLIVALIYFVLDTRAAPECGYTVVPILYHELGSYHTDTLPYHVDSSQYVNGAWDVPADFDRHATIRRAVIFDWCKRQTHFWYINAGRHFIHVWDNWEPADDGYPHPAAAYWITPVQ